MLINCPRCGFSQPKDQYCASCGVDMDKYTPRKAHFLEKLLSNTFVQVALVVGFTLTISYFALKSKNEDSMQSSRRKQTMSTMGTSVTGANTSAPPASEINNLKANAENDVAVQLEMKSEDQKKQLVGENVDSAEAASGTTVTTKSTSKVGSIAIKYSFYEVDRELLNYWIQISSTGEVENGSDGFQSGVISTEILHKQIQQQPLKTETKKIGIITKEIFSAGTRQEDSDSFAGLISEIKLDELNENLLKGTLKIIRKNSQGTDQISVALNLARQNAFFVHWKESIIGFEPQIVRTPPFQILNSRYLGEKTEFVVIVEPFF